MKKIILFNIILLVMTNCQTAEQCQLWDDSPFFATFTALQDNEKYILSVRFNAKNEPNILYSDLQSNNISIDVIVKSKGTAIDTVSFSELYPSGVADKKGKANVSIYGVTEWRNSRAISSDDLEFSFNLYINDQCYYQNVAPQSSPESKDILTLYPSVNKDTDSTLTFILYAQRNALKTDEYLPNSEKLRVVIYSEKGELKWNSSFYRNFLQVVSPVSPDEVGGIYKYSLKWDGYDIHGKPVPPGTYRAQLIIPAKPITYSESIVFKWKI